MSSITRQCSALPGSAKHYQAVLEIFYKALGTGSATCTQAAAAAGGTELVLRKPSLKKVGHNGRKDQRASNTESDHPRLSQLPRASDPAPKEWA